jgi:CSLREA domain-containing protein
MHTRARFQAYVPPLVLTLVLMAAPCLADDIYVTTTEDTNDGICGGPLNLPCSLRDAVISANARAGPDDIWIPAGIFTLTIPGRAEDDSFTGDLDLTDDVVIHGSGMNATVVRAVNDDRVFHNFSDSSIRHLRIVGGDASNDVNYPHGGGLANSGGSMWLYRCVVAGNITTNGVGGGLYNRYGDLSTQEVVIRVNHANGGSAVASYGGRLGIRYTTISENLATDYWFVGQGGALWATYTEVTLNNATVTNNETLLANRPGGLMLTGGITEIDSCTLADNDWDEIANDPIEPAFINLGNTIISGNCSGPVIHSRIGNVEGPGDTCWLVPPGDQFAAPIFLMPLGDYGGFTLTRPPERRTDNPVVDNLWATAQCEIVDQRGVQRPQNAFGSPDAYCDSGAVELGGMPFEDSFETGDTSGWSSTSP